MNSTEELRLRLCMLFVTNRLLHAMLEENTEVWLLKVGGRSGSP